MEIKERIEALRKNMKKEGVFAYYIPTSDDHGSEYIHDHYKVREFFTGFTGSAGVLLVTEKEALLWVDGRYFIQAEAETDGSLIKIMKTGLPGVPGIYGYIRDNFPKKAKLGFDGRVVDIDTARKLKKALPSGKIVYEKDLSEGIFERKPLPATKIRVLPEDVSGESSIDRIAKLREDMKKAGCDAIFLSALDEIAYLFNIRADDIEYNPVALAYAYITLDKAYIFLRDTSTLTGYAASIIKDYRETEDFLKSDVIDGLVMADPNSLNYTYYKLIRKKADIKLMRSPVVMMKAVKNPVEIGRIKDIYYWDSLQLTRFIRYILTTENKETEMSASDILHEYRRKIPEFRDLSFETIMAYKENAAIIHYSPSHEHEREIAREGMLMVDSGGQYEGGTTDVTRTIVMGEISDEEKQAFTDVAVSMLRLRDARFPKGVTGVNLDILARERMWRRGMDFRHGTGHGVGYMLNVHEGPQAVRTGYTSDQVPLAPGMLISDEPGIYLECRFGIRTEDILLVEEDRKTSDGTFLKFYDLTQVPIDDRGMDYTYMEPYDIRLYEEYQRNVYESLSKKMTEDEKKWLYEYTGLKRIEEGEKEHG